MNKLISIVLISLMMTACGNSKRAVQDQQGEHPDMAHNSRNALDWEGVYRGIIPCASCEGIKVELVLFFDDTYQIAYQYLGKDPQVFRSSGALLWDERGGTISLGSESPAHHYQVGEGFVAQLDMDGQKISGALAENYVLKKLDRTDLTNRQWHLVEIFGQTVHLDAEGGQNPHLVFLPGEGRVAGNAGCNNFFGAYVLEEGSRIRFSGLGSTLMACPDMELERRFMEVLEMTDNYLLLGDTLMLHKARMAPLARLESVYFKQ